MCILYDGCESGVKDLLIFPHHLSSHHLLFTAGCYFWQNDYLFKGFFCVTTIILESEHLNPQEAVQTLRHLSSKTLEPLKSSSLPQFVLQKTE